MLLAIYVIITVSAVKLMQKKLFELFEGMAELNV